MEREPLKKENECIDFELDLTEEDYKDLTVDNYEIKHFIIKIINFSIIVSGFFIIREILKLKNDKLTKTKLENLYNTKIYKPEN